MIGISGKRVQDIANEVFPGFGYLLAILIFFGGIIFNIGNLAGTGMGLNTIFGIDPRIGAAISALICIIIFTFREAERAMDKFVTLMASTLIILIMYIVIISRPPIVFSIPSSASFDSPALITLIGGTGGGYILFAGAHRLVDAGIKGDSAVKHATNSSVLSAGITLLIRYLLFFAILGAVLRGIALDPQNPASTPFAAFAGSMGYKFFGLVLWCVSISSVIGCSFTSISFIRTFFKAVDRNYSRYVMLLIAVCSMIFIVVGKPVELLLLAGVVNGLVLPFALLAILLASRNPEIVGKGYHHPWWLLLSGIIAMMISAYASWSYLRGLI